MSCTTGVSGTTLLLVSRFPGEAATGLAVFIFWDSLFARLEPPASFHNSSLHCGTWTHFPRRHGHWQYGSQGLGLEPNILGWFLFVFAFFGFSSFFLFAEFCNFTQEYTAWCVLGFFSLSASVLLFTEFCHFPEKYISTLPGTQRFLLLSFFVCFFLFGSVSGQSHHQNPRLKSQKIRTFFLGRFLFHRCHVHPWLKQKKRKKNTSHFPNFQGRPLTNTNLSPKTPSGWFLKCLPMPTFLSRPPHVDFQSTYHQCPNLFQDPLLLIFKVLTINAQISFKKPSGWFSKTHSGWFPKCLPTTISLSMPPQVEFQRTHQPPTSLARPLRLNFSGCMTRILLQPQVMQRLRLLTVILSITWVWIPKVKWCWFCLFVCF